MNSLNNNFLFFSQASSETTFARESVLSSDEESLEPSKKYQRLQKQEEIGEVQPNFKQQHFEFEGVDLNLKDHFDEDVDMGQSQDSQGSFSVNEVSSICK
jgi:hypothetical protein